MSERLQRLLSPRSIAIVGASEDFRRISGRPLRFLLEKGYAGRIFPVNPKYEAIGGLPCYEHVRAIPEDVDLAIIVVPAHAVPEAIDELAAKRTGAAVVFSSGFAEMGAEGARLQSELIARARVAGVRICGPNCLGLINAFENVIATFGQYADGPTPPGPVGFVTQSGAFGTAIAALARRRQLGLGYFVNTGNEADLTFAEIMRAVIDDPRISVGAGYIEGCKDGAALIELAVHCMAIGKPLIVTKVGRTAAGARAAASHTGSLAGEDSVFDGVARQFGIVRARNEEHMLDLVEAFTFCALPQGRGVGIVTQSGGAGVLMADRAEELGLTVAALDTNTTRELAAVVPGFGVTTNPVDITGQFVADPKLLERSVEIVLSDPGVAVGIVWLQLMDAHVPTLLAIFESIKQSVRKPFVVCWVAAPEAAVVGLHRIGLPILRGAEPAIEAVAGLVQYAGARESWRRGDAVRSTAEFETPVLPRASGIVPTPAAQTLLAAAGVSLAPVHVARSADEAVDAARACGFPVALKIESPDIAHKTEAGGVALALADERGVREAYATVLQRCRTACPQSRVAGVVVQPMLHGDLELVIGLQNDAVFGPVVMVGLGGIFVEVFKDVSFRHAPVSAAEAEQMLAELDGRAMLDGVRGKPPADRRAIARQIAAVSRFGAAAGARLRELDLNPVMVSGDRCVAVDWLLVLN